MKRYPRTIPDPFAIDPSRNRTCNPHFTSRGNHQILSQKDPLYAVGLLLWLGDRRHLYRCGKYYIFPAPPLNYLPKLGCICLHYRVGYHPLFGVLNIYTHVQCMGVVGLCIQLSLKIYHAVFSPIRSPSFTWARCGLSS